MALTLEPLKVEDLDRFIKLHWDAFAPLEVNMIYPMLFPRGLQPDLVDFMRARFLKLCDGDVSTHLFGARDTATGEIIGISSWKVVEDAPRTKEEIDAKFAEAAQLRDQGLRVEGVNGALYRDYFAVGFYSEAELMAGQRYMTLRLLATDPRFQRRGTGSFLLKPGLEKADRLGLPVFLHSGISGRPLYERFGFKVVSDLQLNCLDYGGRSDGRHWLMLRPARQPTSTKD